MSYLYTIIAELNGGTFIEQISESSMLQAFYTWLNTSKIEINTGCLLSDYKNIHTNDDDLPTLIDERVNVWYHLIEINDALIHLNIVKTVQLQE